MGKRLEPCVRLAVSLRGMELAHLHVTATGKILAGKLPSFIAGRWVMDGSLVCFFRVAYVLTLKQLTSCPVTIVTTSASHVKDWPPRQISCQPSLRAGSWPMVPSPLPPGRSTPNAMLDGGQ